MPFQAIFKRVDFYLVVKVLLDFYRFLNSVFYMGDLMLL